jgi:hypothetical protein
MSFLLFSGFRTLTLKHKISVEKLVDREWREGANTC